MPPVAELIEPSIIFQSALMKHNFLIFNDLFRVKK